MKEKMINIGGIIGFYLIIIIMVLLINARFSYLKTVSDLYTNTKVVTLNN